MGISIILYSTHTINTYYVPNSSDVIPDNQVQVTKFTNSEIDFSISSYNITGVLIGNFTFYYASMRILNGVY